MAEAMSFQNPDEEPSAVSVSPRGVEEPRMNPNTAQGLDDQIREAAIVADRLDSLKTQLLEQEEKLSRSTVHLQERLQVSAQVLKAFQAQINQVENVIRRLQEQESNQQSEVEEFEDTLDHLCKVAIDRFEKQLNNCVLEVTEKSRRPIESLVDEVRQRIEPEVERVSAAIRTVAEHVETLTTAKKQENSKPVSPEVQTTVEVKNAPSHDQADVITTPPLRLLSPTQTHPE